ncbi:DUF2634 domain-containing protein [Robertmurraya andreesenii]|uniref:Phage baseplate assembly protein W n=1 Tax=Anoxybacillus andreesenii TaxID=1325932 RepID=A0ABT9V1U8_9BACL|nr:DUF2634 domain-containing protein [Robertmurraya andreesenii]MDQ0154904.1 phage baseplate assembly protein W [Robertmurraya andreesenii]
MALSPLHPIDERSEEVTVRPAPSKTYQLNANTNEIGSLIDGEQAIRQFIVKAVKTARFRFLIYDDQYGSELDDLIGADVSDALLQVEIPRVIREALIYDDRVDDVVNFDITREGDRLYVEFTVVLADGTTLTEGVTI